MDNVKIDKCVLAALKDLQANNGYLDSLNDINDIVARLSVGDEISADKINMALANIVFFKEIIKALIGKESAI